MNTQIRHFHPLVFFLLLLAHISFLMLWPKTLILEKKLNQENFFQLITINSIEQQRLKNLKKPLPTLTSKDRPTLQALTSKKITFKENEPETKISSIQETEITKNERVQKNEVNNSSDSRILNTDIKGITQSLREEFKRQDKHALSKADNTEKFRQAITYAAIVNRDGVRIENKHLFDGRPVSKVSTPFGTYCILHPKQGEKLELTPSSAVPMSCGRL